MTVPSNVVAFPIFTTDVSYKATSQGGTYVTQVTVTGGDRYPMRGGQGDYQPRNVLLSWDTTDGATWTFRHAVIVGQQIDKRTGQTTAFSTSQTITLDDPTYADCEPSWLAGMVTEYAPGTATA